MSWLEGRAAKPWSAKGRTARRARGAARSTPRSAAPRPVQSRPPRCERRAEGEVGVADPDEVAVAQPLATPDASPVDKRAVARGAVVDERPLLSDPVEHGVHPRDGCVLGQGDIARRLAADRHPVRSRRELEDPLLGGVRPVDEVRPAAPVRVEALLELGGRRRVRRKGQLVHTDPRNFARTGKASSPVKKINPRAAPGSRCLGTLVPGEREDVAVRGLRRAPAPRSARPARSCAR